MREKRPRPKQMKMRQFVLSLKNPADNLIFLNARNRRSIRCVHLLRSLNQTMNVGLKARKLSIKVASEVKIVHDALIETLARNQQGNAGWIWRNQHRGNAPFEVDPMARDRLFCAPFVPMHPRASSPAPCRRYTSPLSCAQHHGLYRRHEFAGKCH